MRHARHTSRSAFTLIELLVVITIIGLLSTTIMVSIQSARVKANNARRVDDFKNIKQALEMYYDDNRAYPMTSNTATIRYRSQCATWGSYTEDLVIPGLTPTYMPALPADPAMNAGANVCCYVYTGHYTGRDYKFFLTNCDASIGATSTYAKFPGLLDPRRDGINNCLHDDTQYYAWAIYTPGGCSW